MLGGDPAICPDATAYFFVYSLMIPFSQLNSLTSAFLQCSGDMVTPSILNAVMCVLDILFNSLLIPRFGVLGAGMGTALAWCHHQSDHGMALLHLQQAAAPQTY